MVQNWVIIYHKIKIYNRNTSRVYIIRSMSVEIQDGVKVGSWVESSDYNYDRMGNNGKYRSLGSIVT